MLKRLVVLSLLTVSVGNYRPLPGQTPDNGDRGRQNPESKTGNRKTPSTPSEPTITVIKKNCDSEAFKNDSDCKSSEQKPSTIEISKLPPARLTIDKGPERDVFDWISYWGNILLVIVGIGTLIAVWKQAVRMKEHAEELKKLAAAALLTAQATENQIIASHDGLRAWLDIEIKENVLPPIDSAEDFGRHLTESADRPPRFVWKVKNHGQSPAFIQQLGSKHAFSDAPNLDTMSVESFHPIIDFVGAGAEKENLIVVGDDFLSKVDRRQKFWRIALKVKYLDAFDKTRLHETMATFHYYVPPEGDLRIKRSFYREIDPATNYNT